jgi:16S rRNA processing protein RimM
MILVGRVARPHGIRGQVVVNPETDFVEERFAAGAIVWTRVDAGDERLIVSTMRVQNGRPIVGFEGFERIEDVERLAGVELRVPEESLQELPDGAFYQFQLVGCAVETTNGERVGDVARVDGGAGGSVLAIDGPRGEILIPFAVDICVEIDVAAKRIRIDPPEGLLELNETQSKRQRAVGSGQ